MQPMQLCLTKPALLPVCAAMTGLRDSSSLSNGVRLALSFSASNSSSHFQPLSFILSAFGCIDIVYTSIFAITSRHGLESSPRQGRGRRKSGLLSPLPLYYNLLPSFCLGSKATVCARRSGASAAMTKQVLFPCSLSNEFRKDMKYLQIHCRSSFESFVRVSLVLFSALLAKPPLRNNRDARLCQRSSLQTLVSVPEKIPFSLECS